jgi:hypothetical protein
MHRRDDAEMLCQPIEPWPIRRQPFAGMQEEQRPPPAALHDVEIDTRYAQHAQSITAW